MYHITAFLRKFDDMFLWCNTLPPLFFMLHPYLSPALSEVWVSPFLFTTEANFMLFSFFNAFYLNKNLLEKYFFMFFHIDSSYRWQLANFACVFIGYVTRVFLCGFLHTIYAQFFWKSFIFTFFWKKSFYTHQFR